MEKDLGESEVLRKVSAHRLGRWQHRMNPNEKSGAINIKSQFYRTCQEIGIPVPEVYAVGRPDHQVLKDLPGRFLVKPVYNFGGNGISAYTRRGTQFVSFEGEFYEPDQLVAF